MVLGRILQKRIHIPECQSTNDALWELLDDDNGADEETGLYVTADYQQTGRGHGSTQWHSSNGLNILLSFHATPQHIPPIFQFDISRMIALSLLEFSQGLASSEHHLSIKWPNDLYAGNKKLGGILIENRVMGQRIAGSVIGIGLNVNESEFPAGVPNPTSLKLLSGQSYDRDTVLNSLVSHIRQKHRRSTGYEPQKLKEEYDTHLFGLGAKCRYKSKQSVFEGMVLGTDRAGLLRLHTETGERYFGFKEVSLLID